MEKTIKIDHEVYAILLQKKSEVVAKQGKNISFSNLIKKIMKNDY